MGVLTGETSVNGAQTPNVVLNFPREIMTLTSVSHKSKWNSELQLTKAFVK
jgi:hypothetical protein